MKRWTAQLIFGFAVMVIVGGLFFLGNEVFAQTNAVKELRRGASQVVDQTPLQINSSNIETSQLPTLLGRIIGNILSLLGVVFFILTLYAGFLWMFARGDEGKVTKATDIIKGAIAGLIVVLGSYALTNLVFDAVGLPNAPAPEQPAESAEAPLRNPGTRPTGNVPLGGLCVVDEECVPFAACTNGHCTDLCDVRPPQSGATCRERSSCDPGTITENLCTGGENRVCCQPLEGCYPALDTPECASQTCGQNIRRESCVLAGSCCVWLGN